jgi:hypothetical protein
MFVRDAEEGRRRKKKERKMWVTRRKRRRRREKGKCASVIGVVKSRLVDRIDIYIRCFFFFLFFSLFLSSVCQLIDFRMTTNIKNKVNWLKRKIQTNKLINNR